MGTARAAAGGRVVRLILAYDGTAFHGFARQPRHRTVEGTLETALRKIVGVAPTLSVAGRTDAGVHARGQVVSFPVVGRLAEGRGDAPDLERLRRALNGILAPQVVVRDARLAPASFDARHSATGREYRYRVSLAQDPDPFEDRYVWHQPGEPSLARMRAAAAALLGEHDFAAFCRRDGRPTVRRLTRLAVSRRGDRLDVVARANAFCHQMVRSLVGTLLDVGDGRIEPSAIPSILRSKDRARAGRVAPARGLTLERVFYGGRR